MKTIKTTFAALAVFAAFAYAGTNDYTEQVLYTMPQDAYEQIVLQLGEGCTDREIVKEYMNKRSYYDSLSNY